MSRTPILPTDLADVPAWLRYNARRWSMRILFLADELEMELERRAAFKRIAAEQGIRIIDIPRGLEGDDLQAFITRHVLEAPADTVTDFVDPAAETEQLPPLEPITVGLGNVAGHVINELIAPRKADES